ncbi:hypothetical protein ERX37_01550 [Macrococcus hajekii]|uniref:DUF1129 family protein n=1 Tax=Macrococcus hajekii TaxID=198482 RepID=A0A4R6BLW9_9STAP|nr:hypothetical protein [Macrococcus hajekii]TDM02799.1 hypothetical protein ERX37_01550 [Macrococcus hajekii]GGB03990.1 hypothetical protein GCM10007190_10030 [Macrococcus hajekii]
MLSEKSEQFLLNMRLELLKRGKKEDEIEAIEEELRDHLYEAEKRGESVDNVTGGSVDEYIKTISKEMALDKGIIKTILGGLVAVIAFFLIPRMIADNFELTSERLIFYGILIFVLIPAELWLLIEMLKKYGHTKKGYLVPVLIAFGGFLLILGGEFFLRSRDSEAIVTMDASTSFWLGLALMILFIIACVFYKTWFYIGVIIYLVLPDLIARIMTDAPAESKEFINISTTVFLMLSIVAMIGALAFIMRQRKKGRI